MDSDESFWIRHQVSLCKLPYYVSLTLSSLLFTLTAWFGSWASCLPTYMRSVIRAYTTFCLLYMHWEIRNDSCVSPWRKFLIHQPFPIHRRFHSYADIVPFVHDYFCITNSVIRMGLGTHQPTPRRVGKETDIVVGPIILILWCLLPPFFMFPHALSAWPLQYKVRRKGGHYGVARAYLCKSAICWFLVWYICPCHRSTYPINLKHFISLQMCTVATTIADRQTDDHRFKGSTLWFDIEIRYVF